MPLLEKRVPSFYDTLNEQFFVHLQFFVKLDEIRG